MIIVVSTGNLKVYHIFYRNISVTEDLFLWLFILFQVSTFVKTFIPKLKQKFSALY